MVSKFGATVKEKNATEAAVELRKIDSSDDDVAIITTVGAKRATTVYALQELKEKFAGVEYENPAALVANEISPRRQQLGNRGREVASHVGVAAPLSEIHIEARLTGHVR